MYIEWGSVASTDEPVSVAAFKEHARTASSTEDTLISGLLSAAREYVERNISGEFLLAPRSAVMKMPNFPLNNGAIQLPAPISASTNVALGYYDTAGSTQTLTRDIEYMVLTPTRGPGKIIPLTDWPETQELNSGYWRPDAVVVTMTAGSTVVSELAKQAIKLVAADWYENRENTAQAVSKEIEQGLTRISGILGWGFYA